jgi:multiple sugar transport system substrate-binding protein
VPPRSAIRAKFHHAQIRGTNRHRYRITLVGALVLCLPALLSSGSAQAAQSGTSKLRTQSANVTLTYALWAPEQQKGYEKVAAAFERLHPNIHINIQLYPFDAYWTKLFTGFSSHTGPDVFWGNNLNLLQLIKQHDIMPQTKLIKRSHINLKAYVNPNFFRVGGQIWALPKDWDTIALVYNKDLFAQNHVTMPAKLKWNPSNGGSLVQLAQRLTVDKNGHHPGDPGFDPNNVASWGFLADNDPQQELYAFIAQNGGAFIKPYGSIFTFNQAAATSALQFVADLILKYNVSPPATMTNPPIDSPGNTLFLQGQLAMYPAGDWNLSSFASANFKWGVVELPAGPKGGATRINSLGAFINAHTRHPKEAWEWASYVSGPTAARIMASQGLIWPSLSAYDSIFAKRWLKQGVDVSAYAKAALGPTVANVTAPCGNQAVGDILNEFNLMFLGSESVPNAVNKAKATGDKDISACG